MERICFECVSVTPGLAPGVYFYKQDCATSYCAAWKPEAKSSIVKSSRSVQPGGDAGSESTSLPVNKIGPVGAPVGEPP